MKIRVDAIGYDKDGNLIIKEFKSSSTAPLTRNQRKAFVELKNSGGTVVREGKGIFIGGFEIPEGIDVKVIRPN